MGGGWHHCIIITYVVFRARTTRWRIGHAARTVHLNTDWLTNCGGKWRKLVVKSSVVPQRLWRLRDR